MLAFLTIATATTTTRTYPLKAEVVRILPFFRGWCFCGHESHYSCKPSSFIKPGHVFDHLACEACGAKMFFVCRFKHIDNDGAHAYRFVQAYTPEDLVDSNRSLILGAVRPQREAAYR